MSFKIKSSVSLLAIQLMLGCYQAEAFNSDQIATAVGQSLSVPSSVRNMPKMQSKRPVVDVPLNRSSIHVPEYRSAPHTVPVVQADESMATNPTSNGTTAASSDAVTDMASEVAPTPQRVKEIYISQNEKSRWSETIAITQIGDKITQSMQAAGLIIPLNLQQNPELLNLKAVTYWAQNGHSVPQSVEALEGACITGEDFELAALLTSDKRKKGMFRKIAVGTITPQAQEAVELHNACLATLSKHGDNIVTPEKYQNFKHFLGSSTKEPYKKLLTTMTLVLSKRTAFDNLPDNLKSAFKAFQAFQEQEAKKAATEAATDTSSRKSSISASSSSLPSADTASAASASVAPTVENVQNVLNRLDPKKDKAFIDQLKAMAFDLQRSETEFSTEHKKVFEKAQKKLEERAQKEKKRKQKADKNKPTAGVAAIPGQLLLAE